MSSLAPVARSESEFARGRQLLLACVGLAHGPLAVNVELLLAPVVQIHPATVAVDTLGRFVGLSFVALLAWLAFEKFDTGSGVSVIPRRWADVGALAIWAFIVREFLGVSTLIEAPARFAAPIAARWELYTGPSGELLLGWLSLAMIATATAEEIVYRALLLRALEGYMNPWLALTVHALVFEGVHVFVYDLPFQAGGWFINALIWGYAFQRTRSLAVPVLMHAIHNLTVISLAWTLVRQT